MLKANNVFFFLKPSIRFDMFSKSEIKYVDNDKEAMIQHYSGNI